MIAQLELVQLDAEQDHIDSRIDSRSILINVRAALDQTNIEISGGFNGRNRVRTKQHALVRVPTPKRMAFAAI